MRADAEMATHTPLGAVAAPRSDTDVSEGPGPASDGPGAGPSLISPACQDAKLEDLKGLPAGWLHTTRQNRRYLLMPTYRKYLSVSASIQSVRMHREPVTVQPCSWAIIRKFRRLRRRICG